jgi:hypothetical protein
VIVLSVLAGGFSAACKKKEAAEEKPQVETVLPIQRVVLYRNGVGYFERFGKVAGEEIRFKVRDSQVGDFLASLAVVTASGEPVEFVTFPVRKEEEEEEPPVPPMPPLYLYGPPAALCGAIAPPPPPPEDDEEEEPEDQIEVVVKLQSATGERDVLVAYVVESPVWRPTYRVVLDEGEGKALLQGWAVVQNMSGEDWENVWLTMTEGAPLTFRADLGTPYIPWRPVVTDRGEVVQAVVSSSVSVSEETRRQLSRMAEDEEEKADADHAAYPARAPSPGMALDGIMATGEGYGAVGGEAGSAGFGRGGGRMGRGRGGAPTDLPAAEEPAAPPPEPPGGLTAGGAEASLALLALGSQEGGITTYSASAPVTVRDEASTLVAIFNQRVEASDTLLYRPDGGVPASSTHPFRVVRFTNQAGVALERGPVAIFARERFLGQGLLEPVPMGATTSIPYALERGVTVSVESASDVDEARLVKIEGGLLTVRRYSLRKTKYVVQNLSERAGTVYVQHRRWSGWETRDLPAGSEEVDALTVIVPVAFGPQAKVEVEVVERSPTTQQVQLMSDVGSDALALYLSGPAVDDAAGPALRRALEMRREIGSLDIEIGRHSAERDQVSRATSEVRSNLYAIEGNRRASDLQQRLTARLTELETRYADLQTRVIDLTSRRGELVVELAEAIRDVRIDVPESEVEAPVAPAPGAAPPAAP